MRREFSGERVHLSSAANYREIVLSRPDRRNAIDTKMRDELAHVLRALLADPKVERIGLLGAGPAFCSGGDLGEFGTGRPVPNFAARTGRSLPSLFTVLADRLVVGVHGACIGAGVELSSFAKTLLSTADARFRLPELRIGLLPGMGGTVSIPRRIGRGRTLRWLISGDAIDARTAQQWGLVDAVVPDSRLVDQVRRFDVAVPRKAEEVKP